MVYKKTSLLLAFALSLSSSGCGPNTSGFHVEGNPNDPNIINGTVVTGRYTEAAKSLVVIERIMPSGLPGSLCTATLIGPNTILSASHCFNKKLIGPYNGFNIVFTDNYKTADRSKVRRVFKFEQHPKYLKANKKNGNHMIGDVAVATFIGDIPAGYKPVAIDTDTETDLSGETVYAYGYGRGVDYTGQPKEDRTFSKDLLRRGVMTINNEFKLSGDGFWTTERPDESKLCQGDSGGPIFYHNHGVLKQIGVNSAAWGPILKNGVQSCSLRSYAAKVSHYYSWIKETEQKLTYQMNNE